MQASEMLPHFAVHETVCDLEKSYSYDTTVINRRILTRGRADHLCSIFSLMTLNFYI